MQSKDLENYIEFLLSVALQRCGNIYDAEDLTQETLLAALSYTARGKDIQEDVYKRQEYIHIVELRLTSADNNSVTYEYCADHNNDWGKIHYTFGEDDYDVVRYIYADKKGGFYFASVGEWVMHNINKKHFPKYMIIHISQD